MRAADVVTLSMVLGTYIATAFDQALSAIASIMAIGWFAYKYYAEWKNKHRK